MRLIVVVAAALPSALAAPGCFLAASRYGRWRCGAMAEDGATAAIGATCSFTPHANASCGGALYADLRCGASRALGRFPACFWRNGGGFEEAADLAMSGTAVERDMVEWRERVLKPPAPDSAYLRARCNRTRAARRRRRRARRYGHVITGDGDAFSFGHVLNVAAAIAAWRLKRVYVHHVGSVAAGAYWWREVARAVARTVGGEVVFREHAPVASVFGWKLESHAHRADIIRLEALMEFGGCYLDTDVLPLRPVDDWLDDGRTVLAVERPAGLINAVICAPRNARFLRRWYQLYASRGPHCWNCASITWVPRVAFANPCAAKIVKGSDILVKGQYSKEGIARVSTDSGYDFSKMRAAHFFNNQGGNFYRGVRPDHLNAPNATATYHRMLVAALGAETLSELRAAYAGCPAVAEEPCGPGFPAVKGGR